MFRVSVAFKRLYDEGYLERHGDKRGCYRKKETDIQKTKFIKEKIIDFPVILPLDLNTHLKIYPKSVIMIAGSKSAGKTAMALTIAMKNQDFTPVRYMHSEGGDEEFSERMQNFGITDESEIHFEAIPRAKDFHDLVTAEKKIFIIDYLEVHKDFYEIGIPIKQIHDNLKDGIAIICLQKKHGELYGRGNEFSQEVARLYLSMEYSEKEQLTKVIIVDAKAPKGEESMRGWFRSVKITRHGTRLTPTDTQWNKPYGN